MKKILLALLLFPALCQAQVVTIIDSSGYLKFVNPLTNSTFLWTNLSTIGSAAVLGYVPTTTKVNGHALSGDITVTPTDLSLVIGTNTQAYNANLTTYAGITPSVNVQTMLGSANNAAILSNIGAQASGSYVPQTTTVNGHALSGNVSVTASDVSLGNVTNESKATMFTNATFTGTFATAAGAISNAALANGAVANLSGTNTGDQTISDATITTTDITTNDFTTAKHGFVPKGTNVGNFLKDDGTWAAASGSGTVTTMSIVTANGISGSVANATTTPAVTLALGAITPTTIVPTGAVTLAAGTTGLVPINIPASVQQTTPASGDITRNASTVFTAATTATENGLLPSTQFAIVPAGDFALQNASGVQSAFPTTNDVWTLAASTAYFVEGVYMMTTATTTTKTTGIAFALGGGASVTLIGLEVMGWNGVANTTATAQGTVWMAQVASTVITATATTGGVQVWFRGIIQMNAGGTVTPQINFSANPGTGNAMKAGSWISFTKLGTNTTSILGSVN